MCACSPRLGLVVVAEPFPLKLHRASWVGISGVAAPPRSDLLAAIQRSAAGSLFFAEELAASVDAAEEVIVPLRLREVSRDGSIRLEPVGGQLLAALAVIDDGVTAAELAGPGTTVRLRSRCSRNP